MIIRCEWFFGIILGSFIEFAIESEYGAEVDPVFLIGFVFDWEVCFPVEIISMVIML